MSTGWFEISPVEIAFLANAGAEEDTVLDQVSTAGDWLRSPVYRDLGGKALADRSAVLGDLVDDQTWSDLTLAARLLVVGDRGSALSATNADEDGFMLVTAWSQDQIGQLLLKPAAAALRLAPGLTAVDLDAEVTSAVPQQVSEIRTLRWSRDGRGTSAFGWRDGAVTGLREGPADQAEARMLACQVALFEDL